MSIVERQKDPKVNQIPTNQMPDEPKRLSRLKKVSSGDGKKNLKAAAVKAAAKRAARKQKQTIDNESKRSNNHILQKTNGSTSTAPTKTAHKSGVDTGGRLETTKPPVIIAPQQDRQLEAPAISSDLNQTTESPRKETKTNDEGETEVYTSDLSNVFAISELDDLLAPKSQPSPISSQDNQDSQSVDTSATDIESGTTRAVDDLLANNQSVPPTANLAESNPNTSSNDDVLTRPPAANQRLPQRTSSQVVPPKATSPHVAANTSQTPAFPASQPSASRAATSASPATQTSALQQTSAPQSVPAPQTQGNGQPAFIGSGQSVAASPAAVPQFVPVPVMMPVPQMSVSNPEVETTAKKTSPETKLPEPNKPEPNKTDTVSSVHTAAEETPESQKSNSEESKDRFGNITNVELAEISDQRAALTKALQASIEKAKKELFKEQSPAPQKIPRKITKLESDIEAQLKDARPKAISSIKKLGATGSVAAVPILREYLQSHFPDVQQAALAALKQVPDAAAPSAILDALQSPVAATSEDAVRALTFLRREETIPPLMYTSLLKPSHQTVFVDQVLEDDEEVQQEYANHFQKYLSNKNPRLIVGALRLLSRLPGKENLELYLSSTHHKSSQVRSAAIEAMAACKGNKAVRILNKAIADPDSDVRQAAAVALAKVNSPKSVVLLIRTLQDEDINVRRKVAKALTKIDDERIPVAASKALELQTDPTVIEHLLQALGQTINKRSISILKQYLDGEDIEIRNRAITTLKRLRDKRSAKLLLPHLESDDITTRRLTVEALSLLKEKKALPEFRKLLKDDSAAEVQTATARALGELEDKDSIPLLEDCLNGDHATKIQAIIALGKLKAQASFPALLAQLQDSAPDVRYHAAMAIGELPELPNAEPLLALAEDSDDMVRRGVRAALEKHGVKYRSSKLQKQFKNLAATLTPAHLAGGLPLGPIAIIAIFVGLLGWGGYLLATTSFDPASSLPVMRVENLAISPDGRYVAVSRRRNVYETWDTKEQRYLHRFQLKSPPKNLCFAGPKQLLLLDGSQSQIVSLSTEMTAESFRGVKTDAFESDRFVLSKDGELGLFVSRKGPASVVDLQSGKVKSRLKIDEFEIRSKIAIAQKGKLVLHLLPSGKLIVFNGETGKSLGQVSLSDIMGAGKNTSWKAIAVDASGELLAVCTSEKLAIVDLNKFDVVLSQDHKLPVSAMSFLKNSKDLIIAARNRFAKLTFDSQKITELKLEARGNVEAVNFSTDGTSAVIKLDAKSGFIVVDLESDKVVIDAKSSSR